MPFVSLLVAMIDSWVILWHRRLFCLFLFFPKCFNEAEQIGWPSAANRDIKYSNNNEDRDNNKNTNSNGKMFRKVTRENIKNDVKQW